MTLVTIKNLSRHELRCEQKSFLGGSLQQDHKESFLVVEHLESESNIIKEGTAEGSDDDFNIKSDPEYGDMGASDKLLKLFCIFVS